MMRHFLKSKGGIPLKLMSLILKNFKGVKSFEFQPNGENATVKGKNGTGKTTVFDALIWLLFDKDSQNRADFDIKPIGKDGSPVHMLQSEVEAIFDIDGKPLKLHKVFAENYTKKRGSITAEFTGHTTDYYINDVPVKKGEYVTKIDSIAREDVFRLLTNPAYFNSLKWQDRRKILIEIVGDITDEAVIESNAALKGLAGVLNGRTIEEHRKVIASKKAEINKEIEKIPVRIDELQRSIPEAPEKTAEELQSSIDLMNQSLTAKQQSLADIQNGGAVSAKRIELQQIESQILALQSQEQERINGLTHEKYNQIDSLRRDISSISGEVDTLKRKWNQETANVASLELKRNSLIDEWKQINAREFTFEQSDTCPTCGQPLPEAELLAAREKAQADFNLKKSSDIEANVTKGKQIKADLESAKAELPKFEKQMSELVYQKSQKEEEIVNLQKTVDEIKSGAKSEEPVELVGLRSQKQVFSDELQALQAGSTADAEMVRAEINAIVSTINDTRAELAKFEQIERAGQRLEELKQQEQTLAKEFEKLEGELFMTEEFIRAKVNLLEDRINSKFKMAKFKLFDTQINGGLVETCETLYNGVPYSSNLNTGHKILVGLDIINTLSEHYGFAPMVFVDNAESITEPFQTRGQIIRLVASPEDKTLAVEYDTQIMKEAV
jgi:DNA repair exonuclease SbcCD ATPase subunit